MKKIIRRFLITALLALIVIQFISIDKSNPPVQAEKDFMEVTSMPDHLKTTFKAACYDCHSHETSYPWYTNVQPVAWWVKGHIKEGRRKLNLSTWLDYEAKRKAHKLEEMVEEIDIRNMPLKSYTWMHSNAKLSQNDRNAMMDWLRTLESQ